MPLTGQAKKDYQRKYMKQYMRDRRAGLTVKTQTKQPDTLRPKQPVKLRPAGLSESQWNYIQLTGA